MKFDTNEAADAFVTDKFVRTWNKTARVEIDTIVGGQYCSPQFRIRYGTDEAVFRMSRDYKWRLMMTYTYGKGSFIYGDACDASGYVLTDEEHLEFIDSLALWQPYTG